ncbi:MAG: SUMF1/EgtB/PvdO family nonheme iron enzyme [Planctomycetota bacterium]|nr:SUMF1/EgtB/PvdO family nonheme iron enzyme [Planctomycetota bacterium]
MSAKPLLALLLFASSLRAAETPAPYPLWDHEETVEQYAQRAGLAPTKTLDLGGGVTMDLVLIPAGRFLMGTPEPTPVDEAGFRRQIVIGQGALALGCGVVLVLVGAVLVEAIRTRQRPKVSLARLLAMTTAAGLLVLGGMHWHGSVQALEMARAEFKVERRRFSCARAEEKPAHWVTLTHPYYMGKFEVTYRQYCEMLGRRMNPALLAKLKDRPMRPSGLSEDIDQFCQAWNEKAQPPVRLPTEAEWEFACRAGTTTLYYSGDSLADLDRIAVHGGKAISYCGPVGQKAPNAFGLYDMLGNVSEWCQDWYGPYPAENVTDPQGPSEGVRRVSRGGSTFRGFSQCRSASRNAESDCGDVGFRIVMPVP